LNRLAFALAAYRADHGSYPEKLADLVPKYTATVPLDAYRANKTSLQYRREADGYLLYSVGPNGKDDGGKTRDDASKAEEAALEAGNDVGDLKDWDDLVVRMGSHNPSAAKDGRKASSGN
jgi:hypothetical protein